MEVTDFQADAPGKIIRDPNGHWTFIPDPLPPRLEWTSSLVNDVSQAERALGRLSGLGYRFPNPERLVRLFLRREAELSSRIENTHAKVRTQLLFEHLPEVERDTPDVREVRNNFEALEYGLHSVQHRPLSLGLIKEMHKILLRGVRGQEKTPGQFRNIPVHIGRNNRIEEARFVPPPAHAVEPCMRQLEQYIRHPDGLPPIVRAAAVHYQFEAIHPFADGNGRIGRVLILLILCTENTLLLPLLNPSAPLERSRREYYDLLLEVSRRGNWGQWIAFFARGVSEEATASIERIERLEQLREQYQSHVRTRRASALLPRLVDQLFVDPTLTLGSVMKLLKIKAPSAQKLIDKLVQAGIVQEVTGKQRNRVYLAQQIIEVLGDTP
ncbi:Fic family protein [Fontivita pretiosa]|uniref:Fic family protein n=1 Tax=Fontivita pretiosa TaxID=2989684 RepID=UPI003D18535B